MAEIASLPIEPPRRFHVDWLLPALFRPRRTFAKIVEQSGDVWLTPILVVMVAAVAHALVTGWLKQIAALSGPIDLPPDFQYWAPDQQNQFMQAQAAASGPVFLYVFPSILSALSVWVGWLVVVLLLLVLGVRVAEPLPAARAWGGVLITILIVLLLQALPGFAMAQFSGLNII